MRDAKVGHAGLHNGTAVVVVNLQDTVELSKSQKDPIGQRQSTAGERGSGASRYDFDVTLLAIFEHRGDLLGRFRQNDNKRRLAIRRQSVRLIRAKLFFGDDDPFAGHDRTQTRSDFCFRVDYPPVGVRHSQDDPPQAALRATLGLRALSQGTFLPWPNRNRSQSS